MSFTIAANINLAVYNDNIVVRIAIDENNIAPKDIGQLTPWSYYMAKLKPELQATYTIQHDPCKFFYKYVNNGEHDLAQSRTNGDSFYRMHVLYHTPNGFQLKLAKDGVFDNSCDKMPANLLMYGHWLSNW